MDKEILKNIKIIPVSEAYMILQHSLTKQIVPLNITESEVIKSQKTIISSSNIDEPRTH